MKGISIGCVPRYGIYSTVILVKLIRFQCGMFVNALVGLYTIEDLLENFGDLKMSIISCLFPQSTVL
jgi:hypothetical protein